MDLSPQAVASASFAVVKKGYDPDEVRAFLGQVSTSLESANQQATAMEARARAAMAKVQELNQQVAAAAAAPTPAPAPEPEPVDEVASISRALLLAQKAADQALDEARAEAASILEQAHAQAAAIVADAQQEGRHARDVEIRQADEAVQALLARREFLLGDVDQLEQHVQAQRERLRDAAAALHEMIERVPAGFGDLRRPLLSAADHDATPAVDEPTVDAPADEAPADDAVDDVAAPAGGHDDAVPSTRGALRLDLKDGWHEADDATPVDGTSAPAEESSRRDRGASE